MACMQLDYYCRRDALSMHAEPRLALAERPHLLRSPPEDAATRWMHARVSPRSQTLFRDRGHTMALLDCMNYAGAAAIGLHHPSVIRAFTSSRERFRPLKYGPGEKDRIHVQDVEYDRSSRVRSESTLVFVHGGAWGSGQPWMYFLCAHNLARALNCDRVVVVEYALYPQHSLLQQADSVSRALKFARELHPGDAVVLSGHSSGANLCALAVLADCSAAQTLLLFNGVFDIRRHYRWEASRGVHLISPMGGAAAPNMDACSPTLLVAQSTSHPSAFPAVILVHNVDDTTVPLSSSQDFALALRRRGVVALTHFPQEGGHIDVVLQATVSTGFGSSQLMQTVAHLYHVRSVALRSRL